MPSNLCMESYVGDVQFMYRNKMSNVILARMMAEVPIIDKLMSRHQHDVFGDKKEENIDPYNKRLYHLSEPYVEAYNFAERLNLWGEGPPNLNNNMNLVSISTD